MGVTSAVFCMSPEFDLFTDKASDKAQSLDQQFRIKTKVKRFIELTSKSNNFNYLPLVHSEFSICSILI